MLYKHIEGHLALETKQILHLIPKNSLAHGYININQAAEQFLNNKTGETKKTTAEGLSFQDILTSKTVQPKQPEVVLKFSKHATSRLEERDIQMTAEQMERLNEGTARAQEKGIRDSLVMVDSLAFIVNIPNQTVVTAMDQLDAKDNIFTNIDGAVIA